MYSQIPIWVREQYSLPQVVDHALHRLIRNLNTQQLQHQRYHRPLAVVRHPPHLRHRRYWTVTDLLPPHIYHPRKISIGQRVVIHRLQKRNSQRLVLRLFAVVYLRERIFPKIEFAQSCIRIVVPSAGYRAFSAILVSSISRRCTA